MITLIRDLNGQKWPYELAAELPHKGAKKEASCDVKKIAHSGATEFAWKLALSLQQS